MSARDETYNYPRFKMSNYELGYFPGPKAGEVIDYDYKLTDLDGNEVELSDYKGKWLVIESGSLTCPMYVKNVKPFAKLKVEGENNLPKDKTEEKIIYSYENRDTENDPFKGTDIEGKD